MIVSSSQIHLLLLHVVLVAHLLWHIHKTSATWSLNLARMWKAQVVRAVCGCIKHTLRRTWVLMMHRMRGPTMMILTARIVSLGRCWLILSTVLATEVDIACMILVLVKLCVNFVAFDVVIIVVRVSNTIYFSVESLIKFIFRILNPLSIELLSEFKIYTPSDNCVTSRLMHFSNPVNTKFHSNST